MEENLPEMSGLYHLATYNFKYYNQSIQEYRGGYSDTIASEKSDIMKNIDIPLVVSDFAEIRNKGYIDYKTTSFW